MHELIRLNWPAGEALQSAMATDKPYLDSLLPDGFASSITIPSDPRVHSDAAASSGRDRSRSPNQGRRTRGDRKPQGKGKAAASPWSHYPWGSH